jgi:hypothetical protein
MKLSFLTEHTFFVKSSIFLHKTQCSLLKVNRRFGGRGRIHLQGRRIRSPYYLLHVGFLLGLFFDPEDVGDMFLQYVAFRRTTWRYIPDDNHRCESLKWCPLFYILDVAPTIKKYRPVSSIDYLLKTAKRFTEMST